MLVNIVAADGLVLKHQAISSNNTDSVFLLHILHHAQRKWLLLTHWGRDKMTVIFQTTFSNAFSWMKMCKFWLTFHWRLFPNFRLTIFQHWFRWWFGAWPLTSHYLNQWWLVYWCIYASLGLNELRLICKGSLIEYEKRMTQLFNPSPPNATYMRQWIGSALVLIMACRLFGTKPLS